MRKISLFLGILTSIISAFGYSSNDISNAEFLAEQGIITSQPATKSYRLDDTITRAEVIGIALKLKGITLPDSYYCKNYFSDVKYNANNNWICRAVELAADDGIISRANTKARPQDSITKAEALGAVINSRRLTVHDIPGYDDGIDAPFFDTEINWQRDAIMIGFFLNIIDGNSLIESEDRSNFAKFYFYPNRRATRAEVFSFARNILGKEKLNNTQMSCKINGVEIYGDCKNDHGDIRYGKYIETQIYGDNLYQGAECAISYENQGSYMIGSPKPGKYGKVEYIDMSYLENGIRIVLGYNGYYEISSAGNLDNCMDITLLDVRKLTAEDVFNIYYGNLDISGIGIKEWAYRMRSPAGVSEEAFVGWYKNVTAVKFHEDTLKDLGDNTYEFLVDMTENGVKSTYKVKSKVDLANFKINNISSVKQ